MVAGGQNGVVCLPVDPPQPPRVKAWSSASSLPLHPRQRQLPLPQDLGLWLGWVAGQGGNTVFSEELYFLDCLCVCVRMCMCLGFPGGHRRSGVQAHETDRRRSSPAVRRAGGDVWEWTGGKSLAACGEGLPFAPWPCPAPRGLPESCRRGLLWQRGHPLSWSWATWPEPVPDRTGRRKEGSSCLGRPQAWTAPSLESLIRLAWDLPSGFSEPPHGSPSHPLHLLSLEGEYLWQVCSVWWPSWAQLQALACPRGPHTLCSGKTPSLGGCPKGPGPS